MILENRAVRVPLTRLIPSPEATACLPESAARRLQLVPLARRVRTGQDTLLLACVDPSSTVIAERLKRLLPEAVEPVLVATTASDVNAAINKCYASGGSAEELNCLFAESASAVKLMQEQPDAIVRLFESLLLQASRLGASDIHLSPSRQSLSIRLRIDGVMQHYLTLSMAIFAGLLVRIKVLASMDIAETRRPQDGQFSQYIEEGAVDFRVSCFPTTDGQNIVIRLLREYCNHDTLERLALPRPVHDALSELTQRPDGLLVVCGPTGSGKSSTLHALLNERDASVLNIMALEDPVERHLEGIRQSSIDAEHAMDYAQGVRGLLRQDPDILLIGEIRDNPSCAMALRAVMSGHQVLTTVHASSALAGLARLRELGALNGQLADNLVAIASQRLLRKRCPDCLGATNGCLSCQGCGYRGRQLVMELLLVTPQISALIATDASPGVLLECARKQGFRELRQQATELVKSSVTTTVEVDRVLGRQSRQTVADSSFGSALT